MNENKRRRWHCVVDRVHEQCIGAEIGVYHGCMSAALLELLPGLTLYMVDRWKAYSESEQKKNGVHIAGLPAEKWPVVKKHAMQVAAKYPGRATVIQSDSAKAAKKVPDNSLDFVFIDADHSYKGCKRDIKAWRPKLKTGGWLMGHDYHRPGVARAIAELDGEVEYDDDKTWAVKV